ncbi:TPA: helix-turn-helix transcriptional regulator [Klebsiella oxytoca]|nr:helix-turn-helix transcriptional regulator [Klebsiella michiganensis]HBM3137857.1 helix-turn-helix transcriptional regulator [Klebsiella oxytoca]HCB0740434.1 helix-turn-helix transcriptional regulator [Klebsiella variicola subsp. variicola]
MTGRSTGSASCYPGASHCQLNNTSPSIRFSLYAYASTLLTTRELCRRLAISERTFHRRIKAETGESPKQFIDRIRCEMARLALETSAKTIKQIAADAGYADEGSFRRVFSRMTGMNPALYRRWVKDRTRE